MHVRVRVCLCVFLLCGAVSCRVPRVVGCWLGGVVWCGVVWCGVVWCGVVWCGVLLSTSRCRGGPCPWSFPGSYDEHIATGKSGASSWTVHGMCCLWPTLKIGEIRGFLW